MDLSSLVDSPPLTLVWYGGIATNVTRQFKLMSCMVGVTCFPDPHIERNTRAAEHLDPALESYLDGLASRMQALAPASAGHVMQAYFDAYARGRPQPAPMKVQASALPPPTCPASPCPPTKPTCAAATTTTGACWRCRTAACWLRPRRAPLYAAKAGRQRSRQQIERRARPENRSGRPGLEPVHRRDGAPRLQAWRPGGKPVAYAPAPGMQTWRVSNWTIRAGGGVALRLDDQLRADAKAAGTSTPGTRSRAAPPRWNTPCPGSTARPSISAMACSGPPIATATASTRTRPASAAASRPRPASSSSAAMRAAGRWRPRPMPKAPRYSGIDPASGLPCFDLATPAANHVQRGAQRTAACWRSAAVSRR